MTLPRVEQSPTDPDFVQDPYRFYRHVRAKGDFVHWADYDLPMATTHEAVTAVLRHRALGRAVPDDKKPTFRPELRPFYALEEHSMLELEPPDHTRLRALVLRAFTTNRLQVLAPDISRIADGLIESLPDDNFDIIERFAKPLPVLVIARLLGIPEEMAPQLTEWSNRMVAMYQARRTREIEADAARAATDFTKYLRDYIASRRNSPRADLLTDLIAAEQNGEKLTESELISTCVLLLNAGHEATVHAIGNAAVHLMEFDGRAEALAPDAIESTVEECIRYDPPLHMFTRHVYAHVEICGQSFRPGDEIGCLLASAARDDAVWPDGEVFDPFRVPRSNTTFGAGIHFCVGAPLAKLELQIALPLFFSHCRDLTLMEPPVVADHYHFRGREKILVRCKRR